MCLGLHTRFLCYRENLYKYIKGMLQRENYLYRKYDAIDIMKEIVIRVMLSSYSL